MKNNNILKNNSLLSLSLALVSIVYIVSSLNNAVGMSIALILVFLVSLVLINVVSKFVDNRLLVSLIISVTVAKAVELLMQAYVPYLTNSLGIFISLLAVNAYLLVEASQKEALTLGDNVKNIVKIVIIVILVGLVREVLSTGALSLVNMFSGDNLFGFSLFDAKYAIKLFGEPAGAFITLGVILAFFNKESKEVK